MNFQRRSKEHLQKACDSALLAVEFYNKPAVRFRSGGYITMMVIAFTSLFHAIFFKRRVKPFYKNKRGWYEIVDGDYRYWELATSAKKYFGALHDAVRANVEFFIPLRNRIEHRSMPLLDGTLFAECQALLLNFDSIISQEFGPEHALRESLSFSLQMFPRTGLLDLAKARPSEKEMLAFIQNYRSSLSPDIAGDSRYAFKAFLVKTTNHASKDALPIQIVDFDSLTEEQKAEIPRFAMLIKPKNVPVSHLGLMKASTVVKRVQAGIGDMKIRKYKGPFSKQTVEVDRFNVSIHTLFWKKYKVRPETRGPNPEKTKQEYCIYDALNMNYGYTEAWVAFLIPRVKDDVEYFSLLKHNTSVGASVVMPNQALEPTAPSGRGSS